MKNVNYEDILADFQKKRLENANITAARKNEIYDKIPEIRDIDNEIASTALDAARNRIRNLPSDTETVKSHNDILIAKKKDMLISHGYPADYLEPVYDCPVCKDTGYADGKQCVCLKQKVIDELYNQSTIKQILEKENFSTFSLEYYSKENDGVHKHTPYENASNVLEKCKAFTKDFENNRQGILIYGETGLGKTFLSNCIAKALLDKGHTVLYLTSINLFENILSDIIMGKTKEKDKLMLYDYIYNCELLIIDDLGTEISNSFVDSQLFEIINVRNNKSLSTLISTNLGMQDIAGRYTERIMSRIVADFAVFHLYGSNIRYAKRRELLSNNIRN